MKTKRIQDISTRLELRISKAVDAALQAYRFDNRFKSESAAVRELVRIGLAALAAKTADAVAK